jgi:hypothetical protein
MSYPFVIRGNCGLFRWFEDEIDNKQSPASSATRYFPTYSFLMPGMTNVQSSCNRGWTWILNFSAICRDGSRGKEGSVHPCLENEYVPMTCWPTHGRVKIIFFVRLHNVKWYKGFLFTLSNQRQVNKGSIACTPTSLNLSAADSSAFFLIGSSQPCFPIYKTHVDRNEWIHINDIHLIHHLVQVNGRREYPSSRAVCGRKFFDTLQSHSIHRT